MQHRKPDPSDRHGVHVRGQWRADLSHAQLDDRAETGPLMVAGTRTLGRTTRALRTLLGASFASLTIHALTVLALARLRGPQTTAPAIDLGQPASATTTAPIDDAIEVSTQAEPAQQSMQVEPSPGRPAPTPSATHRRAPRSVRTGTPPTAQPRSSLADPPGVADSAAVPAGQAPPAPGASDEELDAQIAGPGFAAAGSGSIVNWARSQNTVVPTSRQGLHGRSGTVRLRIGVDAGGGVRFVRVNSPSGDPVLDEAAYRAAWETRFSPCMAVTGPVDCVITHETKFR